MFLIFFFLEASGIFCAGLSSEMPCIRKGVMDAGGGGDSLPLVSAVSSPFQVFG